MADEPIDTEKLRGLVEMATQMDGDCSGSVVAADIVLSQAGGLCDEIDSLRAANERLQVAHVSLQHKCSAEQRNSGLRAVWLLEADRTALILRLARAEHAARENRELRDELADETRKCSDLWDEAETVLRLMDGLAEQWGDEAVFRRCRDRLRAAVEAAQEAGE